MRKFFDNTNFYLIAQNFFYNVSLTKIQWIPYSFHKVFNLDLIRELRILGLGMMLSGRVLSRTVNVVQWQNASLEFTKLWVWPQIPSNKIKEGEKKRNKNILSHTYRLKQNPENMHFTSTNLKS